MMLDATLIHTEDGSTYCTET